MSLSVLKLALLGVVTFAVIGAVFTRKTFHVERVIHAAPEVVWGVLMDSHSYSAWNPVFIEIEGKYEPGAKVRNKVLAPSGKILENNRIS